MFDLSKMNTLNLDQLHPWQVYQLTGAVLDDAGKEHVAGEKVSFERAIVNVHKGDAEIHLLTAQNEPFIVRTQNNAHRALFEKLYGDETRPAKVEKKVDIAGLPENSEDWPAWLAKQQGFADATAILNGKYRDGWGGSLSDGEVLLGCAKHFETTHKGLAVWLAERALDFFHGWMSQATSGGEGTAMQYQIREQLKEARRIAGRTGF
jgi:hypothetical protein